MCLKQAALRKFAKRPSSRFTRRYYPNVRDWHEMKWIVTNGANSKPCSPHTGAIGSFADPRRRERKRATTECPTSDGPSGGGEDECSAKATISDSGGGDCLGLGISGADVPKPENWGAEGRSGRKFRLTTGGDRLSEAPAIHGVIRMEEAIQFSQALLQLKDARSHVRWRIFRPLWSASQTCCGQFRD